MTTLHPRQDAPRPTRYTRVSTRRHAIERLSLDRRHYACLAASDRRHPTPISYVERGASGKHESCPELDHMSAAAERAESDYFVAA